MTGWIALVLIVAVVSATAAIFAAGRKAGAAAEAAKASRVELKSQKEASDAKDRILEAGAAAPRDRDALGLPHARRHLLGRPSSARRSRLTTAHYQYALTEIRNIWKRDMARMTTEAECALWCRPV